MFAATPGVKRGCGQRKSGGVYAECGLTPDGMSLPLEHFLTDPPVPFDADHKLGVDLIQNAQGVWHIVDYVGREHYPEVADVLEEGRRYGFSRRVSRNLDFAKLTPESRLLLVHSKAVLTNAEEMHAHFLEEKLENRCAAFVRSNDHSHLDKPEVPCTRDWYALAPATGANADTGVFERVTEAGIRYAVEPPEPDAPPAKRVSGIIASLPLTNITVIKAGDASHQETLDKVRSQTSVNVSEQDA